MTDLEFDALLAAARAEDETDVYRNLESDFVDLALAVHRDSLEVCSTELSTRGDMTTAEARKIQALKQALLALTVLNAKRHAKMAVRICQSTDLAALSIEEQITMADTMAHILPSLDLLNDVVPLAEQTLSGLGLPISIEEFEDGGGRIKIDYPRALLSCDEAVERLLAVCWLTESS